MANFDPTKDECLTEIGNVPNSECSGDTYIKVAIFAYNKGAPKIRINRFTNSGGGFLKLGSLTADEAKSLAPLLIEAAKEMKSFEKTKTT